jgi:hypothetical protein
MTTSELTPPRAEVVSQRTALAVFGLPPRHFLELVRANPDLLHGRAGKLVLVRVDVLRDFLARPAPTSASASVPTRDAVLAGLGHRRTG